VAVAIAAAAGLLVAFAPQLVARHVAQTYLAGLNIDTSGVETLRLRPLQGYLSFGPVTFRGADAVAGQVGRIGVNIDVRRLLRRQALVQSIVIEGVRFEVRQAADGSLSLNGIPLTQILAESAAPGGAEPPTGEVPPAPAAPRITPRTMQEQLGWGAGLDSLQIRDSRVAFIDARGGEAVMHVHKMDLGGFRTWAPDKPGHYRLESELNDIAVTASGTAKPFADKIVVEADAAVTGIEVTKIERYLGPLGFTSRDGQIDLAVNDAEILVFTTGRVQSRLGASGRLSGVDLAHPLFGRGRLDAGRLTLANVSGAYDPSGEASVAGDLDIDLQASEMHFDNGTEVGFSRVAFALPGTTVTMAPDQQPVVKVSPALDVDGLRFGGPEIRGRIGHAAARLSAFNIDGTDPGAPFLATGAVAVDDVALTLPHAEPVAITAARVQADLTETRIAFPPGQGPRIAGGLALDAHQLQVAIQGAVAGRGRPPPPPTSIALDRLAFEMPELKLDEERGIGMTVNASGPLLSLERLRVGGPKAQGSVGRAEFRLARFGMAGTHRGAPMVATGAVALDRLKLFVPDVEPVSIALDQLRADMAETTFVMGEGAPQIKGGLAFDTRGLQVAIQEQPRRGGPLPPPTEIGAARLSFDMPAVAVAKGSAGDAQVSAHGPTIALDQLRLGGPDIQGTIGKADIRLSRTDVAATDPGAPFTATGTVRAERLNLLVPDVEPVGIIAAQVDANLDGMRFSFPAGRSLIEGSAALDSRDLLITIQEQAEGGAPLPQPIRIHASRFAGAVPTLAVDDSRATGTRVRVATPSMMLDQFRLDAPVGPASPGLAGSGPLLQLAAPTLTLAGVNVSVIDAETLEVAGQARLAAPELSLQLPPGGDNPLLGAAPITGRIGRLGLELQRFSYREAGTTVGFGLQGKINLGSMQGRLPASEPGETADLVTLSGLRLDVADLDVAADRASEAVAVGAGAGSGGGTAPVWRAKLDLDLQSVAASLHRPLPLSAEVTDIQLRQLDAASAARAYALHSLTIGGFDASLHREAAAAPQAPPAAEPAQRPEASRPWPPPDLPSLRLGRIELIDGGRISLLDRSVSPPVAATLAIDTLHIEDIDTTEPNARTSVRLQARLNDGRIGLDGWATAFRDRPSLALRARLDDLQLPTLSPYFAPAMGMDIVSGTLSAGADGTVTEGRLDGAVEARLVNVRMVDRLATGGGPALRPIGEPLSTLIRLIEDRDGSIEVSAPLSGDMLAPEVGYAGVIWGLLPRVLRAFFTSPVRFVSATRSLINATDQESSAAPAGP
jgi:hypothetical protein